MKPRDRLATGDLLVMILVGLNKVYDLSLQKASGYGSLKAILQILALDEGLTAAQIARRLRVTSATASDYLRWLCEVDLIQVKNHNCTGESI